MFFTLVLVIGRRYKAQSLDTTLALYRERVRVSLSISVTVHVIQYFVFISCIKTPSTEIYCNSEQRGFGSSRTKLDSTNSYRN